MTTKKVTQDIAFDVENFLCSVPEYWKESEDNRPKTLNELMECVRRPGGFWAIRSLDSTTGKPLALQICENCLTDNGAISMFKNTLNFSAGGIAVANILVISQLMGYCALTTQIASGGTVTSITVGALTGPTIPNGTTIRIGAGGATSLNATLTQAITGPGTFTVSSVPGPASAIIVGSNVRAANAADVLGTAFSSMPTTDVSSIANPVSYTAPLPTGNFVISGTGVGNRQMVVNNSGNYLFSTTSNSNGSTATVASYTDAWIVNTNPVSATSQTFVHVGFDAPVSVNSSTNQQIQITEKL